MRNQSHTRLKLISCRKEALDLIKEAIEFHIEGLKEDGEMVPAPHCDFTYVEVSAA